MAEEFTADRAMEMVLIQSRDGPLARAELEGAVGELVERLSGASAVAAEFTSLPATLLILVLAFGALVAAGIPLLLGFTAVLAALGLTALISHLLRVDESINSVILLIGLAVGVDYSLFYLRRVREERARGRPPAEALQVAAATSGRAVLVSGLTVMTAMAGMFLMGTRVFQSFGVGTMVVVAIAIVGSLTVLPAVLSLLGDRVDRGRIPVLGRLRRPDGESRFWTTVVDEVLRRPLFWGGLAAALLIVLTIPAFRLHTASSGVQGLPHDLPVMRVYDRLERAFPGGPLPAVVVVSASDVTSPQVTAGIEALKRAALATGEMMEPIGVDVSTSRRAARVRIALAGKGHGRGVQRCTRPAARQRDPVHDRRRPRRGGPRGGTHRWLPRLQRLDEVACAVRVRIRPRDDVPAPAAHVPLARDPAQGDRAQPLSVGAAYGVLVLVFQDGRLESLLGFQSIGGVTAWLPLFLFVVLFGLSMDYHVFILSRVREAYEGGLPTDAAVSHGIRATASVVTSAAIVMVAVFAIFATLGMIDFKMMGVGLAVAVFLDATIVRAVLLPATMKLLGDWNWYLPRWLEWLPRSGLEPRPAPPTIAPTEHVTATQPASEPQTPVGV